jgi:hypothetical protein
LHLSLSGSGGHAGEPHSADEPKAGDPRSDKHSTAPAQGSPPPFSQYPRQAGAAGNAPPFAAARGPAGGPGESPRPREAGAFIDQTLRERIDGDIAAFLAAFDEALDHDTTESRTGLREATDRLLRAGARTRIELERLEARVPLSARDKDTHTAALYRTR